MKTFDLHFRWTVSRAQDTYGYNIVTLLVDDRFKSRCNGGGYDMQGTVFADWLVKDFQNELKVLFAPEITDLKNGDNYRTYLAKKGIVKHRGSERFYGVTIYQNTWSDEITIGLDGACGFSSIERIANAIGIKMQWNKSSDRFKNHTFYTAIIEAKETVSTNA